MENSTYLPNPMTSPALMVLASTAEASREGSNCMPLPPHIFPMVGDKDRAVPYTATSYPMYRQSDHFQSSLYGPMPPFVRPNLDMNVPGFLNAGGSAFRPVQTCNTDTVDVYHAAFTSAKRKHDDSASTSFSDIGDMVSQTVAIDYSDHKNVSRSGRDDVKDERPSSISSSACDTASDVFSEADLQDRSTPDEGRSTRKQRKRFSADGQTPCCPVCGITLRLGEIETHFEQEMEKIDKISRNYKKSYSPKMTSIGKKSVLSPTGSHDPLSTESTPNSRYDTYIRIRSNRQNRLSARCKMRKKKGEESTCPVCNEKLYGSPDELNDHVELCLKQRNGGDEGEDDHIDIEGEYEEYTWAGQTRIRATTMLPGGLSAAGFPTVNSRPNAEDDDIDLVVDGDDSTEYGPAQFTEVDVIPCSEDKEDDTPLRNAILQCATSSQSHPSPNMSIHSRPLDDNSEVTTTGDEDGFNDRADSSLPEITNESAAKIIESLKARLKSHEKSDRNKCLICMENYTKPLTSIQCWHVYCSQCWLRTLGAKKLCPQCNMITSPSDLRVIYL